MPKKTDPFVKAAKLAEDFVVAVDLHDGTVRSAKKVVIRRDRLINALFETLPVEGSDDGEVVATAARTPAA
jgi:hypothetical protein